MICSNFRILPAEVAWPIFLNWYAMQYRLPAEALRLLMAVNPWAGR